MIEIYYSSKFVREYKTFPKEIKEKAKFAEKIFRQNPFHSKLETHKLGSKLNWGWSFSIDKNYRIIFEFQKKNIIWFHSVGDHSIYR